MQSLGHCPHWKPEKQGGKPERNPVWKSGLCKGSHVRAYYQSTALEVLGRKQKRWSLQLVHLPLSFLFIPMSLDLYTAGGGSSLYLKPEFWLDQVRLQHVGPGGSEYQEVHNKQCLLNSHSLRHACFLRVLTQESDVGKMAG